MSNGINFSEDNIKCKCQKIKSNGEYDILTNDKDKWFLKKLSRGRWFLFYNHKKFSGSRGIRIYNCPFCGRKLGNIKENKISRAVKTIREELLKREGFYKAFECSVESVLRESHLRETKELAERILERIMGD